VEARLHPDNHRSARLLERTGFVFEGHTVNSFWSQAEPSENSDDWIYGLTPERRRDWLARPTGAPASVKLVEPSPDGLRRVLALEVHQSQDHLVAPVAHSLAQVAVPPVPSGATGDQPSPVLPWPRVVEADGEPVGFVMVRAPDEASPEPYLWRLLIDRRHQGRGIGRSVLDAVVAQSRAWGASSLSVSWHQGPGSPGPFYERYGFVPTGEVHDDEVEGRLVFEAASSTGSGERPRDD
jgi:GNAT superfamily N-acetyltransferase